MASTEMPTLAIELLTEPLPLPSSPPPPPDFAGFPEDVEPPIESILSEKIRIGSRLLKVQGFRLASSRPVYRMSHHATTSDWLYVFGGYRSGWWKLLDWARGCYPQWFLPRDFVFKVYGPSPDRKDMGPKARASLEFEAYKRLSTRQGRNVPKCYGVVLFQYQAALLLQHIDGVTLGEWHASSDRVATNVKPPDMTANEPLVDRRRRESQLFLSSGQQREECEQSGELETMHEEITELVRMLNCYGVKGDLKVDNFIYGNKSLWIIDFDLAKHDDPYLVTAENDWGLQRLLKTLRSYTGSVVGVRILVRSPSTMIPAVELAFELPAPSLLCATVLSCVSCRMCPCPSACQVFPEVLPIEPLETALRSCNAFRRGVGRQSSANPFSHQHEEGVAKGYPTIVRALWCYGVRGCVAGEVDHPAVHTASLNTDLLPGVCSEPGDKQGVKFWGTAHMLAVI